MTNDNITRDSNIKIGERVTLHQPVRSYYSPAHARLLYGTVCEITSAAVKVFGDDGKSYTFARSGKRWGSSRSYGPSMTLYRVTAYTRLAKREAVRVALVSARGNFRQALERIPTNIANVKQSTVDDLEALLAMAKKQVAKSASVGK